MKEFEESPITFFSRIVWGKVSRDKYSIVYGSLMILMGFILPYLLNIISFLFPIILFAWGITLIIGGIFALINNKPRRI